jgi:hypothetical protein
MLARPVGGNGHEPKLEWYPAGRLVMWAAILAALVVIAAIPNFGTDAESFRTGLRGALNTMLGAQIGTPLDAPLSIPDVSKIDRLIDFLVNVIPPAAAVLATVTNLFNLWLAAHVVRFSGRLARPWPQLSAMRFPPLLTAALALVIALSFADGFVGIVAGVTSASLLMAYGVLGFAVLHEITRGTNSRPFVLGGAYVVVLMVGWLILAACLLGVFDTLIDVRARIARKRKPTALT